MANDPIAAALIDTSQRKYRFPMNDLSPRLKMAPSGELSILRKGRMPQNEAGLRFAGQARRLANRAPLTMAASCCEWSFGSRSRH
ncbi:hypothetical protein [Bradyrhizobium sp. AZCC 2230]|uniref:hypothetical protein n=1 Tax=Bradyrhizobium sp. AZCC 2230 TaxID=3117021 RepID=UPI002FF33B82